MRRSAALLCQDAPTRRGLQTALKEVRIEPITCHSGNEAMELVMAGKASTLIVDFDLAGARDVIKMAAFLTPPQRPVLLAVASRAWPGTGQAFQSGADRILYKPLDVTQVRDALESGRRSRAQNQRRSPRHEMKTVVYFEIDTGTLPAIGIDISEHGFAVQATEPVPMHANLPFRCVLPGTDFELHGHADVIWASDQGRAGLFFSKLSTVARKHLKQWMRNRAPHGKDLVRALLPPLEAETPVAVD